MLVFKGNCVKMKRKILKKHVFIIIYSVVAIVCVALDQLTKLWIFDGLLEGTEGNYVNELGVFLRFRAVYNEGAAFGIGQDDGANIVFFVITILGLPLFCWMLWRSRTRSICGQIGFTFIIGGTIGNAIDRAFVANSSGAFFAGKVRDFIAFSIFPPVFNVADSFLTVGVVLVLFALLFFDPDGQLAVIRKEKKMNSEQKKSCEETAEDTQEACQSKENSQNVGDVDGKS